MGLLALTRKVGESIYIGDNIIVTIERIKGSNDKAEVRVTVDAPREIEVLRDNAKKRK